MSITRPIQPLDHDCVQILEQIIEGLELGSERSYDAVDLNHAPMIVSRAAIDARVFVLARRSLPDPFRIELVRYDNGNGPRWYPTARRADGHDLQALRLDSADGEGNDLRVLDALTYGALRTYTRVMLVQIRRRYKPWVAGITVATTDADRLTVLARTFPALRDAPGVRPWDRDALATWACGETTPIAGRHAARFVLALERPEIWPFDVLEALAVWGADERAAFIAWASNPWRPGTASAA